VIADDECDAAVQLAGLVPIEQVNQAMVIARDQKCNWDLSPSKDRLPVESGCLGQRRKRLPKLQFIQIEIAQRPFDAHKEEAQFRILVLVGVQNIAAVRKQKIRDSGYQSLAIGGVQQQDCAVVHGSLLCGVQ
jgi:hypothetical protein